VTYNYELRLRRFESGDAAEVWNLHELAVAAVPGAPGAHHWDDLHDVMRHYIDSGGEFPVGIAAESVVAMGGFQPRSASKVEIMRMRVHPDWRGRGLGKTLLGALERAAREHGYRQVYLETTVVQTAALGMYRRHGYLEVGRTEKSGLEVVEFRKTLAMD
jgi:ribosomal protein S18 acetylase RimI-like enzyme